MIRWPRLIFGAVIGGAVGAMISADLVFPAALFGAVIGVATGGRRRRGVARGGRWDDDVWVDDADDTDDWNDNDDEDDGGDD